MEKSSFFTSLNGDRKYKSTDFVEYFSKFIGNGVFPNPSTNLQVIANGDMTLTLVPGFAYINGHMYGNTDNLILTVDHADSALKRIDRIVVKCDFIGREIKTYIKKGIFASTPIAPTLERGVNAYEISLADVLVESGVISIVQSKITDTRLDSDLCGIVTQTVNTIDTTTLYRQLQAHIQEKSLDMNTYLKEAKDYFSNWLSITQSEFSNEFNTWFDSVKDSLDGDVAGNLLNKINALEDIVNNLKLESGSVMRPDGSSVENALYANGINIFKNEKDIESLKLSGVDGKARIAAAITFKKVPTAADATFEVMDNNIRSIEQVPDGWNLEEVGEVTGSNISESDAIVWSHGSNWDKDVSTVNAYGTNSTVYGVAFSPDGRFMSAAHYDSPNITIYKIQGDTFTNLPNPSTLPAGNGNGVAFSPDSRFMSVAHSNFPNITIYKIEGDTFTKLPNPSALPANNGYGTAFSPDGKFMSVSHFSGSNLTVYKRQGDTFTKIAVSAVAGSANGVAFSPDSKYMSVVHVTSPLVTVYKIQGDTFTKLPQVETEGVPTCVAFSPDGKFMSVGHDRSVYISIYSINGDAFTKMPNPTYSPVGDVRGVAFSPDSKYMSVACRYSPFIIIYKIGNYAFNKITDPSRLPSSQGHCTAFSPDGKFMSVGAERSSHLTVYKSLVKATVTKFTRDYGSLDKLGYAKESKNAGEQIQVNLFPKFK